MNNRIVCRLRCDGRNRQGARQIGDAAVVDITGDLCTLPQTEQWKGLRSIGMVEREFEEGEKRGKEWRYFINSIAADANIAIAWISGLHWNGLKTNLAVASC